MAFLRLFLVILLTISIYNVTETRVVADECDGGRAIVEEGCPAQAPRPNGCKCCSNNHCISNYCNPLNKCANPPN